MLLLTHNHAGIKFQDYTASHNVQAGGHSTMSSPHTTASSTCSVRQVLHSPQGVSRPGCREWHKSSDGAPAEGALRRALRQAAEHIPYSPQLHSAMHEARCTQSCKDEAHACTE